MYDLTKFAALHPGGVPPLKQVMGKDATDAFYGTIRGPPIDNRSLLEVPREVELESRAVPYLQGCTVPRC